MSFPIFCTFRVLSVAFPGGAGGLREKCFGATALNWAPNKRMEPTRQLPRVIMSPMRAAHS
jgi:hypothetical protein